MAAISPNTFDPLKRYISVRLQQGVPIVDADWNELEDVRRFELRAFLKWFIGDGVPEGGDGFRVVGTGASNDFTLSAGLPNTLPTVPPLDKGLRQVGRILVDGLDVILPSDVTFRSQPLHVSQPGSAALAAAWGVPQVPELAALNGTLLIYLDVWERLVTPSEDAGLVFPGLGTESCARLRREWVVRFRQSEAVPSLQSPADPDYLPGHGYYALARVTRRTSGGAVQAGDVLDLRERRLLLPPATLIEDTLGVHPSVYRRGGERPPISLRAALNALIRGELPSSPEQDVAATVGTDFTRRAFFIDGKQRLQAYWHNARSGLDQVVGTHLDLRNPDAGFAPLVQFTSAGSAHNHPDAAPLPDGGTLLVYESGAAIAFKRLQPNLDPGAPEVQVVGSGSLPSVVVQGDLAVFFFFVSSGNQWQFRRYRHTDNTFLDASAKTLTSIQSTTVRQFHAAADKAGNVWAGVRSGVEVAMARLTLADGATSLFTNFETPGGDFGPFVHITAAGEPILFWHNDSQGLMHARYRADGTTVEVNPLPTTVEGDTDVAVAEDAEGALWAFFGRRGFNEIWFIRRDPQGTWGQARLFTATPTSNHSPHPLMGPDGVLWLLYSASRFGRGSDLRYRRLFTRL